MRILTGMGWMVIGAGMALAVAARADCASDCSKQYESAMAACEAANPDPSQSDALQSCMDQAEQSYGTCVAACTDAPGTEKPS